MVEFVNTHFLFDDRELVVTAASGVIKQQGRGFTHAFEIYLEKATLLYDFAVLAGVPTTSMPLTVLTPDGKAARPKLPEVDAFAAELTEAAQAVRGGRTSEVLSGELALDALALCHRETESVLKRRLVKI